MQTTHLGLAHQRVAVGHRETDVQIVPILGLADGANRREVPLQVIGQLGLGHHFVTVEVAADVIPLTSAIHDLAAVMELQRALYARGIAHFVDQLRAEYQRFVVELVGGLCPICSQKTVEITLAGHALEQYLRLRVFWLGQFQAAGLPVAPAIAGGQVFGEFAGQLVGIFPACQPQQQTQAPFGDGVVTQLGVVLGHDVQATAVVAAGERQANFARDGDFFVPREMHVGGVGVEQCRGLFRVLACQAAQSQADSVRHGFTGWRKARRLAQEVRLLRHFNHQPGLRAQGVEAIGQCVGQPVIARFGREFHALPAFLLG